MRVFLRTGPATAREYLHVAFANMLDAPEAIAAFVKKYGPIVSEGTGDEHGPYEAHDLKVSCAMRDSLRAAWSGDKEAIARVQRAVKHLRATITANNGRIEITPRESWIAACLLFLQDQHEGRAAVCANPDCAAPFFIRKRSTQKFCEAGPCVAYGSRQRANKWWHQHGDEWRESNQKSTKGRK
jgi:hypothetical protein